MKQYEKPEIEVICFETGDVVTASNNDIMTPEFPL